MPVCHNCDQARPCVCRLRDEDTGDTFDLCHACRIHPDFPVSPCDECWMAEMDLIDILMGPAPLRWPYELMTDEERKDTPHA